MNPQLLSQLEKIAAAGIQILPVTQIPNHVVFERDGLAVLVERKGDGFGGIGSPGLISDKGFEPLVDMDGRSVFVFKGNVREPEPGQVESARSLLHDLKCALA